MLGQATVVHVGCDVVRINVCHTITDHIRAAVFDRLNLKLTETRNHFGMLLQQ